MAQDRLHVAIAGTSSFIGAALCDALVDRFDIVALTRSPARSRPEDRGGRIHWRQYDHFSRNEVESCLRGADYAVYLAHNRDPSARLDQARTRDRDILVADNFARGASRAGVRQIVYRAPQLSDPRAMAASDEAYGEVIQALTSYDVPVTVLRTGLVIGPGGEIIRLLVRMVKRLPLIPVPPMARTVMTPVTLADLMNAFRHCIGNPETFGREFDVSGPEAVTFQRMLEDTASLLGRSPRFFSAPFFSERGFALLLRLAHCSMHREFLSHLLETLRADAQIRDSTVQEAVTRQAVPFSSVLESCVKAERKGFIETRQQRQRERDDEILRMTGRVRSIQRMRLPAGRNAAWMADHYFSWLGNMLGPFVVTEAGPDGSWSVRSGPGRITLLTLTFQPAHSSPDRRMFFITGGILARYLGGRTARLEFRDVLAARFTITAVHDFDPSLPWLFYRLTQAIMHLMVMKGFQRHMAGLADTSVVRK